MAARRFGELFTHWKILRGDKVKIIAGKDKGEVGTIARVLRDQNRVVVEGFNLVKKHVKRTEQQQGGIITIEAPLHVSNVALVDPVTGAAVRTVFRFLEDGTKVRLLTVHHDGAAGSTPTCISKATAPGVSRAHELLQSHAEGRATQLATNGRVAGSARPPRKGSHHRSHQSCSAPLTLAPGDPQVRVTRGKLASGSIVERPAVLTQRKWDRPSADGPKDTPHTVSLKDTYRPQGGKPQEDTAAQK